MSHNNGNGPTDAPGQNKEYGIIINAKKVTVTGHKINYDTIVSLANITPTSTNGLLFVVLYERGNSDNATGSLTQGQDVAIREGMVFHVTATNKS